MSTPATNGMKTKAGRLGPDEQDNTAKLLSSLTFGSIPEGRDKGRRPDPGPRMPFPTLMNPRVAKENTPAMTVNGLDFRAADANDSDSSNNDAMDKIRAQLNDQTARLRESNLMSIHNSDGPFASQIPSSMMTSSATLQPSAPSFQSAGSFNRSPGPIMGPSRESEEINNLRMKLAQAESQLIDYGQELAFNRGGSGGSGGSGGYGLDNDLHGYSGARLTPSMPDSTTPFVSPDENPALGGMQFAGQYQGRQTGARPSGSMWDPPKNPSSGTQTPAMETPSMAPSWATGRSSLQGYMSTNGPYLMAETLYGVRAGDHVASEPTLMTRGFDPRGGRLDLRYQSPGPINGYGNFGPTTATNTALAPFPLNGATSMPPVGTPVGMPYSGYPGTNTTPLSPHATEFTSNAGWRNDAALVTDAQTYVPPTEPINYRRLLDRSVNCNWRYIVEKIVCQHDQQASIFLQQKLKVSTPEQKFEIVEAIISKAYSLMVNRFGNFLVQRCFEHGTPEQVIKIAESIRTNTVALSMDAFGCHVIQKAFDSVPEEYKAMMVNELLMRIPDTVIHRYACHVWQKLFELRWQETPPQIMKYVNEALHGMWHEVALGETGSLVVQNIFENCLEDDKRPCIEEVLANIDIVSHGQFGNWCIQHICEHGAPGDRGRAIDHVIMYAAEYSTDQYASKVVEKCLKIGGSEFLGRYLDRVCEGRPDRPRLPLIDIASDQYGNYLIQYILTNSNAQHREVVMSHIRKHMVSLRGSKFGSRVGMLCTNPAVATRPGPAVGPGIGNPRGMGHHGSRYSGASMYR